MMVSQVVRRRMRRSVLLAVSLAYALASGLTFGLPPFALAQDAYTPGHTETGARAGAGTGTNQGTGALTRSQPASLANPATPAAAPVYGSSGNGTGSDTPPSGLPLRPAITPNTPSTPNTPNSLISPDLRDTPGFGDNSSVRPPDPVVDTNSGPLDKTNARTGLSADAKTVPLEASGLTAKERQGDYDVVNTQADEFRKRFLQGEAIELRLPMGDQLMSLGAKLPPIRLEATYTQPISLREVVQYTLDNNLDIRIQREVVTQNKWILGNSLGRFLPDALLSYNSQYQAGTSLIGGTIPVSFGNPFVTATAGFRYFGFRGGSVLFSSLSNLHNFRAAKQGLRASINDTLLNVTRLYYNLVQNQALLQIQTRAVDVSKAQVLLNQQLEKAGTGTRFQVLQSETQLARDEQALLTQEVELRRSAIDLATALNLNSAINLLSVESEVRKVRLVDPNLDINHLINIAILNRPELKQFEQLRLAAKRNIQVQAAPLYPQFQFFGGYNGNGQTLSNTTQNTIPSFSIVPLAAPATTAQTVTVQNASAVLSSPQSVVPVGAVYNPSVQADRGLRKSYQIGVRVDWNFLGMGMPDLANIQAARAVARQNTLRVNQTVINTLQQVRTSYLTSLTAERQIEVATKEVLSSAEELRLARVRLANGVGTNIDVINAQRDFTQALVRKAQAIIGFNIQQAQLLRDIGVISYDSITSGRLAR